jgi:hypothetical protein
MDFLLSLIRSIAQTAQFQILAGLIVLDVFLAIAAALRTGSFDWAKLGAWVTGIFLPYIFGYSGFVIVIHFILPSDIATYPVIADAGLVDWLSAGTIDFAWLTLIGTLGQKIMMNGHLLYGDK